MSKRQKTENVFAGKVVVVTGSSRGIGRGFVKHFLHQGAQVIATCRNPSSSELQSEFKTYSDKLSVVALDVADEKSVAACKQSISQSVQHVDILVNNAGISSEAHSNEEALSTHLEEMMRILRVNVGGPLVVTQQLYPLLQKSERPIVVTLSSGLASIANSYGSMNAYRVSKAGVNMLMKNFAEEVTDVKFISIGPGWVATDMGSKGGRSPPLTVDQSVSSILRTIAFKLDSLQSGAYTDKDGHVQPY